MKKISFLLFALSLLFYSNFLSADVVVSGITDPTAMNGTYPQIGIYGGRPYYELTSGMETFSLFYSEGMLNRWILLRGDGPYGHGMWAMYGCGYYIVSSAMLPPSSGYDVSCWGGMPPGVTGAPVITQLAPIPVSLWGIVAVFLIAGGFLVFRYYKKQKQIVA